VLFLFVVKRQIFIALEILNSGANMFPENFPALKTVQYKQRIHTNSVRTHGEVNLYYEGEGGGTINAL